MTVGTFRDQVIYPHVAEDFRRRGSSDTDLEDILNKVSTAICLCFFFYAELRKTAGNSLLWKNNVR